MAERAASSRRRHTRWTGDWSSDVCSSDLAAPVTVLGEHFRCNPHLVEYVARRLYGGSLTVATRSPCTESVDAIEVSRVIGDRNSDGVNEADRKSVVQGKSVDGGEGSIKQKTAYEVDG